MVRLPLYLHNKLVPIYNKLILMEKNSKLNGNLFYHYKKSLSSILKLNIVMHTPTKISVVSKVIPY